MLYGYEIDKKKYINKKKQDEQDKQMNKIGQGSIFEFPVAKSLIFHLSVDIRLLSVLFLRETMWDENLGNFKGGN